MQLSEKHRPKAMSEVCGQDKALAKLHRVYGRTDFDGGAFWIVGPSGTGKTTIANILAAMYADPFDTIELDGEACGVDAVREAAYFMQRTTLSGGWRAWIVNESQAMTPKAVQAWLTVLDKLPARVLVIFTTTEDSADLFGSFDGPFRSRCKTVALTNQGMAMPAALLVQRVARAEGLDGKDIGEYVKLARKCNNNIRAMFQAVESGDMLD